MSKRSWILFFALAFATHLAGIVVQHRDITFFSKFLIVFALGGYFIAASPRSGLNKWIVAALFFSWAGDILLLFQEKNSLFFLLGLAAFLLAHIFYIVFFQRVRMQEGISARWWLLLIVAVYYAGLIFL
ncbi:MAG: lysoplasmalogenase family protein, partial [Chitinophagaceae bacterium]